MRPAGSRPAAGGAFLFLGRVGNLPYIYSFT